MRRVGRPPIGDKPRQLIAIRVDQDVLDQTNYRKSLDQVLALLQVLDCEIDLVVRTKTA